MLTLELKKQPVDARLLKRRNALREDAPRLIQDNTLITEGGRPVILYYNLTADTQDLRWAVRTVKYQHSNRTGKLTAEGGKNICRTFGFAPKRTIRNDYCSATAMARDEPKQHYVITHFASRLTELYREYFPDVFRFHQDVVQEKVMDQYTIPGTPFTSGIINKNNPLKYHHDAGNFKGVLSNMIVFKKGMLGGELACPEYGVRFACADNSVVIFDGQKILHGVTSLQPVTPDAYRYSVVYYSLEQMWQCGTINEEVLRIRTVKKEREFKRLNLKP